MSGGKFASLTANLLVRKGDARPSTILPFGGYPGSAHRETAHSPADNDFDEADSPRGVVLTINAAVAESRSAQEILTPEPTANPPRTRSASPPPPPPTAPGDKPKRLMVMLTPMEHETLGLVAVKKSLTRHQLLRNAVDEYLALLVEEYDGDCACIETGCACDLERPI